jgi:hypothetical protein
MDNTCCFFLAAAITAAAAGGSELLNTPDGRVSQVFRSRKIASAQRVCLASEEDANDG